MRTWQLIDKIISTTARMMLTALSVTSFGMLLDMNNLTVSKTGWFIIVITLLIWTLLPFIRLVIDLVAEGYLYLGRKKYKEQDE